MITTLTLVALMNSNQGCSPPQTPSDDDRDAMTSDAWFESVRWKHRLLVVGGDDDACDRQTELALESKDGFLERDLIVVRLLEDNAAMVVGETAVLPESELFRRRFAISDEAFEVVLIGKDGGVKERRRTVFETEELFGIIDAMPMRIREMRR